MSTSFLIIYFMAIISILIGIGGLIMLIFGLINKKKNLTINGSILSFIAIVLFVSGVFWGARRVSGILWNSINKEIKIEKRVKINHNCEQMNKMCTDSTGIHKDSACCKKMMKECDKEKMETSCKQHKN